jgi:hypothetical protein
LRQAAAGSLMGGVRIADDYGSTPNPNAYPVTHPLSEERSNAHPGRYLDVGALLDGGVPEPPPTVLLRRTDEVALFYSGQVNVVFGDPESGKTLLVTAGAAEALRGNRRVLWVDIDHNGPEATVARLLLFGAPESALRDPDQFRYAEPEDKLHLMSIVADVRDGWRPAVAVVDSIGELLPLMNLGSNSPDDLTIAHTAVLKAMAMAGAAVLGIDHLAKNSDSRLSGPTGTAAKRRTVGGVSIRVTIADTFIPGKGGSAHLTVNKDRHGGLRRYCPPADAGTREQYAGTFVLDYDEHTGALGWSVKAPRDLPEQPVIGATPADLEAIDALDPEPQSVKDVRERLHWGSDRSATALRVWRSRRSSALPGNGVRGSDSSVTALLTQGVSNGERPQGASTCAGCGGPMTPTEEGQTTHPNCRVPS